VGPADIWRCSGAGDDFSGRVPDGADGVLESLIGEIASGEGRKPETRPGSKKLPGCKDDWLLVECDRVDELLDVFRRS
jgi:hypothetical protein